MSVYLPCLNVDSGNQPTGSGIQIVTPNSLASGAINLASAAASFLNGSETWFLNPYTAILSFAINWDFWANLFGLGEGRIAREKATIQQVYTPIFQYLNVNYGVPITDFHALDFPSDGVQQQFNHRPDIAALVPGLLQSAPTVCDFVFASKDCSQGQLERIVNQFLANAAYNQWPVQATQNIWDGIVSSASPNCSADPNRWLQNPQIVRSAAIGGALLRYIPLDVLGDMAASHDIGDPLLESLIQLWINNPSLVAGVDFVNQFPWQQIYLNHAWALPPYRTAFGDVTPLLKRDHIQPILSQITVPLARYPDFGVTTTTGTTPPVLPLPPVEQPPTPPTPQPSPQPTPQPPTQGPSPSPSPQPQPTPTPQPQPSPPAQQPPSVPPTTVIPPAAQQPTYTPAQLAYACTVSQKLYAGVALTADETAWYNDKNNIPLLNLQLTNPACKATPQTQPTTPQQPPPSPPPSQQTPTWTQSELDYACTISRLLYGNAALTQSEHDWYNDPKNVAILNYQLSNPACKTPLTRQTPSSPTVPSQENCAPTPIPSLPQVPAPPGPAQEIPTAPPSQGTTPPTQPCPPDCVAKINEVDRKRQECCDELHLNVIPRIDNIEHWIDDLEKRVPGPPPELPAPYPIPPVDNAPGTDIPFPPADEPVPVSPGVSIEPTPENCNAILQCITEHCKDIAAILKACTPKDLTTDCEEGIAKWGKWAECWLNANTPNPTVQQGFFEHLLKTGAYNARYKSLVSGQAAGPMAQVQLAANAAYRRALSGDYSQLGKPVFPYIDGPGYIFEQVEPPNVLVIPPATP